jgi:TonB family protein
MNNDKILFLSIYFLLTNCFVFSQEVKYYSLDKKEVPKESCYFYTIEKTNEGKRTDTIKSYYCKANILKSVAFYVNGKPEGNSFDYFSNGKLERTRTHKNGRPVGQETIYYSSGIKRANFIYTNPESEYDWKYLISDTWDSLGNPGVKNKNGFCNSLPTFYGEEIGFVKNGLKDSIWQTYDPQTKTKLFEDLYRSGEFLSGRRYYNDKVIEYNTIEVSAAPKDGMSSFYKEIGSKLKYPKEARRARIQGKVFIQFIIDKDGAVTDVKCIKGIGSGCDEAAIEAIKQVKPWIPGTQKGIPVKQRMTLPIDFKL